MSTIANNRTVRYVWDHPIKLVHGAERLVDILFRLEWVQSKSQAKQLLAQGGVRIDGVKATPETVVQPPPYGVLLSKSRRQFVCLQPAYGDPLWDYEDDSGDYLVDQLVREING